jgi:arylsulfatase A-like enzyme
MNVILICIDTLRADHLSCYGYPRLTSPHIDRLAGQGTLFNQMFAESIPTHPSHTTMFTGKDVFSHQVLCQGSSKVELDPGIPTLAERLRRSGYRTGAADNLNRWFSRGFDLYETYSWEKDPTQPWRKAEAVNAVALPLLDRLAKGKRPFFMFVHYWDPHTPYLPPSPFTRMFYSRRRDERAKSHKTMAPVWKRYEALKHYFAQWLGGMGAVTDADYVDALYDAEIAYCDASLAELLARVDELGVAGDTLVLLTSDHGETLHEHEGCWYDHHGLYETNLRIPLILRCPGRLPAGLRLNGLVRTRDIAPTVLDLLGFKKGAGGTDSRSLLPLIRSRSHRGTSGELYLTECTWMKKRGWKTRDWKLIVAMEDPFGLPPVELYDLRRDPGETRNLADERPGVVARLRRRMEAHVARRMRETGAPDPHSCQDITLRQIGKMAAPDNRKLARPTDR